MLTGITLDNDLLWIRKALNPFCEAQVCTPDENNIANIWCCCKIIQNKKL